MNLKKIEKGVKMILEGIGEDTERPGIKDTPNRVARMYQEIFSGLETPTEEILKHIEGESHDELVLLKDIPFYSVCEHHLLPFIGKAHVAYIRVPEGSPVLENLRRPGDLCKAAQVQERLTAQLADVIMEKLKPKARWLSSMRAPLSFHEGIKKPGARTVTSAVRAYSGAKNRRGRNCLS